MRVSYSRRTRTHATDDGRREGREVSHIPDARARALVVRLLTLGEQLRAELREAHAATHRRRDAMARLTGETGTPQMTPQALAGHTHDASERARKPPNAPNAGPQTPTRSA